ncbi:CaiB/BaiF CoA transferase family protein [Orrella sp. 11846]|uniref:CaiB/BaiF CoA transferase family protein n=1 Tax=Orrella sp. 11846 TaxID=3409913 RepID=UPI003B59F571
MVKPWRKIRVLDLSQGIAGPYCAQIMASQGAEVIKVEPPSGDWGRFVSASHGDHSALSLQFNQGKLGVALDAKHPEGQALLKKLVQSCQVVVQNFRPGVAKRLGVDYETLSQTQPDVICVSISGYGDEGPAAELPATDSVMQADSGLMYMNRTPDGQPRRVGMLMVDAATGMYAAQALAAALYVRLETGKGSHVQTSLFEAMLAFQAMGLTEHKMAGPRPVEAVSAPNGVFQTATGQLSVVTLNNSQFEKLCHALDKPEWIKDVRFMTNDVRMQHRAVLDGLIDEVLSQASTESWVERLNQHEVLHAVIQDYDSIFEHAQIEHLQPFHWQHITGLPAIPVVASPLAIYRAEALGIAPVIGEHTLEVLSRLGVDAQHLDALCEAGILKQGAAL